MEKALPEGHPHIATALNNLAALLQDTNRLAEAEPLMRRALAIWEASLPDHHPNVQAGRDNLKALLEAIEAAKVQAPEDPLTRPQSGHPLPRGEREAEPAKRGFFARMFGR